MISKRLFKYYIVYNIFELSDEQSICWHHWWTHNKFFSYIISDKETGKQQVAKFHIKFGENQNHSSCPVSHPTLLRGEVIMFFWVHSENFHYVHCDLFWAMDVAHVCFYGSVMPMLAQKTDPTELTLQCWSHQCLKSCSSSVFTVRAARYKASGW